jgi:1-aminocyclopropane-1-carboxylate synthase
MASHAFPQYLFENLERRSDAWHPETNPDGYIGLCTAENTLMWDLLQPKLLEGRADLPAAALTYDDMVGNIDFRTALARFMGRTFLQKEFRPENVMVLSGAGTTLETLFYAIADRGDSILLPTPAYPGFWMDLEGRDELSIVPVHTSAESGFTLSPDLLDRALAQTPKARALLFTTPNNPLGTVYTPEEVGSIVEWCRANDVHVVFDEIYALSVFGGQAFVSVAQLFDLDDDIHIVWAFSKDFAMSGMRTGVLISENREVCDAVAAQAYWGSTPGDTQHVLRTLVSDDRWVDRYVKEMQSRLASSYSTAVTALRDAGIPHHPSDAGFFLLIDMRQFLRAPTWEAESGLWRQILDEANVNLTPGSTCHISEPGFMRLCFAAVPPEAVRVGVERISALLRSA